jgi:hypothetical protein
MRYAFLGTILLITASDASAEHRPAATWEGEVNGAAVLIVQGDRIDVDSRSADLVSRTSYRFNTPLTADSGGITVENRQGGGRVRVLEQPGRNNNFSAVVEVASRSRGSQFMSLDFYWNDERSVSRDNGRYSDDSYRGRTRDYGTRSRTADRIASSAGTARWSGDVDNEVFVLLRGRQVFNTAVRGRSVYGQQVDISTPLPRRPVIVSLQDIQGRGQVELAEQPEPNNNYTAKVRVIDPDAGAGHYTFTLAWNDSSDTAYPDDRSYSSSGGGILTPNGGYNSGPAYSAGAGSLRWTAQVDGRVRVSFRGNQAYSQRLTGAEVYGEQVRFGSSMPRQSVDVAVNKVRGRGDVNVVQRPSAQNNYTLVIEIDDRDSGSDVYDLEVNWR